MASKSESTGARGSNIRRAYEQCQQARQLWLSVRNRTAEDVPKEAAHSHLHEAVLSWFEALVPYIAERPGEVKQLWESAPLWPDEPLETDVWRCAASHEFEREEHDRPFELPGEDDEAVDLEAGDDCPECGLPVEPATREEYDEDGRRLYRWACGLKRLSAWTNKTKRVRVQGDRWSAESEVREVPQRLDPTVLMRAARYLDLAAEECGLLEETDRALATGEL
jgi:hypothetical protein